MRDISELPGGTEQTRPAAQKPRSPRPKPESTPTGSQEQETKNAPRRRSTTPSHASTPAQPGSEQGNATTQPGNEQTRPAAARPAPARSSTEGVSADSENTRSTQPRPSQPRPVQRNPNAAPIQTTAPGGARPGGNNPNPRNANPAMRSNNGPGNGAPRPYTPGGAPRPVGTSGPGGPRPAPMNRNGGGNGPARQGNTYSNQQRPSPAGGAGLADRPERTERSSGHGSTSARSGQRPGGDRPGGERQGGAGRQGSGRPGGGTGNSNRPAGRSGGRSTNTPRTQERRVAAVKEKPTGPISLPPQIVVKDLADMLSVTPIEIIRTLIKHSIFANINEVVDYEKAALVAQDLGYEPSPVEASISAGERGLSANEMMMATRDEDQAIVIPPVVTIMGHVDHGKTSLLDTIRKTKVAAGEAGGITQHIGAYQVEVNGKKITFMDTPGHEAFTAMRARGAQGAHIAIIVVAADDGVMPQTREAIDHAKAAKVPIIIALNKIDKANANPDRVKQQLADIGVVIEEYGGDVVCVPVSARRGEGIDELLEYILLVAEVQDIRANPNRLATGVIIEARLEKNSGATATVLVQQGTLKMGDNIVVGAIAGKVRAMFNDRGKRIQKAPPSTPVSVLGLPEVPQAGDRLEVAPDERIAKQMALQEATKRQDEAAPLGQVSLDTLYMQMQEGKVKELNIVLKCDVQGSAEAIKGSLSKLGEENMKVRLIREGIGNISETDVHLASASGALIIGFNVKADGASQREASKEGVEIRYYNVIYKLIDDIQAALVGMLEPTFKEVIDGHAEVLQTFKAGKNTVIAGCRITDGKISRASQARVLRNKEKVFDGKIASLRRGKDDVREVLTGFECGIVLEDYNECEIGDIIEAFSQERVKAGE